MIIPFSIIITIALFSLCFTEKSLTGNSSEHFTENFSLDDHNNETPHKQTDNDKVTISILALIKIVIFVALMYEFHFFFY